MTSGIRVQAPPRKPLMVFDGDCDFCRRWIVRWRSATGDQVDYVPVQDPQITERFPEIKREAFEEAVHFIEPDGKVSRGAEAVFRSLAQAPHKRWPWLFYRKIPGAAPVTEFAYRFVAEHRRPFSILTRVFLPCAPSSHALVGSLFLRALGFVYLIAFVSLWTQIIGLVGKNGITPVEQYMQWAEHQLPGLEGLHLLPTLCWFSTSDSFLQMQCAAGAVLSLALILGLVPVPVLFCLWLLYLSLTTACDVFLSFQWDILLLETGFLAIFFAPMRFRLRRGDSPSEMFLWLIRWLLFRLMFESGCVKFLSGDKTWRDLTALNYHYETQPLPTWIGWYAHQLPAGFQKFSVVIMFVIELAVPFLIFAPRRARLCACVPLVLFQVLIAVTGNYCFFNLLTLILCLALLDDAALLRLVPKQWRAHFSLSAAKRSLTSEQFLTQKPDHDRSLVAAGPHAHAFPTTDRLTEYSDGVPHAGSAPDQASAARNSPFSGKWPWLISAPVALVIFLISTFELALMFSRNLPLPWPLRELVAWQQPFRSVNRYGLFAVMTTARPEIIVEGSNDGQTWVPYEFKYKPDDLKRRPHFVAPHQPRLDWQMWFAALGNYQGNRWFINFCVRLLQGSPEVLRLLERNPFPGKPPRYIRAVVYDYHFTDRETHFQTGDWWRRESKGLYCPVLSVPEKKP